MQLRNGQEFKGIELGYFDDRTNTFDWVQNNNRSAVQSRAGDFPAMAMATNQDGLMVLIYQTTASKLQYNKWEKFVAFAEHKDFPNIEARHKDRDLPMEQFSEIYTRFCKSLIGVGASGGQDAPSGMETEFVALNNPYIDDLSDGFAVQVLYRGAARTDAQVEVFERATDGTVGITYVRTDDQGHVIIPVKPDHTYLLDAVVLREPDDTIANDRGVVWETLWASLTFSVPK